MLRDEARSVERPSCRIEYVLACGRPTVRHEATATIATINESL
jgi:hypothetical protein